jgi:hypothetical protein
MQSFLVSSPLIVVGTVQSVEQLGWRNPFTPDGGIVPFRVRVRVENLLQGTFSSPMLDVYTFLEVGTYVGPEPMGFAVGYRYIFYLRRQADRWLTTCDVLATCIDRVLSGHHGDFKRDPRVPLSDDILRLLLTRGDNASDGSMVDALGLNSPSRPADDYAKRWIDERKQTYLQILRQTSETATPPLRAEACVLLRELDQPCDFCANEKVETSSALAVQHSAKVFFSKSFLKGLRARPHL